MSTERLREIFSLAVLGLGMFLLAAMLTYYESVVPGTGASIHNVCGPVGQAVAGYLLHQFGFASYLIVFVILWQGASMFRRRSGPLAHRFPGLVLFMVMLAACLSHMFSGATASIPDPGGDVGMALETILMERAGLGSLGGRMTMLLLLMTSFILASGILYSESLAVAVQWWQEGGVAGLISGIRGQRDTKRKNKKKSAKPRKSGTSSTGKKKTSAKKAAAAAAAAVVGDEADPALSAEGDGDEEGGEEYEYGEGYDEEGEEGSDEDYDEDGEGEGDYDDTEYEYDDEEGYEDEEDYEDEDWTEDDEDFEQSADDGDDGEAEAAAADDSSSPEKLTVDPVPVITSSAKPSGVISGMPSPGGGAPPAPAPINEEDTEYSLPELSLLAPIKKLDDADLERATGDLARKLTAVLTSFKIDAKVVGVQRGPSITMLEVELAAGTKLGKLRVLEDDLAMNLSAKSVRIVAPIPGKPTAGIEIPNEARETVGMRELLETPHYRDEKYAIPMFLGKDSAGRAVISDLAEMPHVLVAGSTGAGKSVCLNTMIMSFLFTRSPQQVKMILIDPKMVELSLFQNVPHLMCPVVTDMKRAASILEWAVEKMEARYQLLHEVGVRNIYSYNKLGTETIRERMGLPEDHVVESSLPFIVIVIDELADLMIMAAKDVEQSITRLAQKSRAVGIHVILATQRPSTNVITGLIKANLPTRIAFRVASKIDSRVILDVNGADKLLGAGDMLFLPPRSSDLLRVQGTFIADKEIRDVVKEIGKNSKPSYSRELMQKRAASDRDPSEVDELFDEAAKFVVETQRGSASLLQRRFQIGYTRASRLIDLMNSEGLLGDYKGSQAREVLLTWEEYQSQRSERQGAANGEATADQEDVL